MYKIRKKLESSTRLEEGFDYPREIHWTLINNALEEDPRSLNMP